MAKYYNFPFFIRNSNSVSMQLPNITKQTIFKQ